MTYELLKALAVIIEYCLKQDNCKVYVMRDFCSKMPCEW